jgi:hypothetical protein
MGGPPLPIQQRRLSEILRDLLRVDCDKCKRLGEIQTSDAMGREFESRSRKSAQDDKWNFCLPAAKIVVNRSDHEQTTAPEPLTGFQGEGGACSRQG